MFDFLCLRDRKVFGRCRLSYRYRMSTSEQSLLSFAQTETAKFSRMLVGMVLLVSVAALPATVTVLAFLPEAVGYLVISMASLTILFVGTWDGQSDETGDEESSITFNNTKEAIYVTAILYTFLAGSFSALLVVSAGLGYLATSLGAPAFGLIIAAIFVYLDHWIANQITYLSVVNCSWKVIERLLRALSVLFNLPTSLPAQANHQRRNLY